MNREVDYRQLWRESILDRLASLEREVAAMAARRRAAEVDARRRAEEYELINVFHRLSPEERAQVLELAHLLDEHRRQSHRPTDQHATMENQ